MSGRFYFKYLVLQCNLLGMLLWFLFWLHCFAFCRKQLRKRNKEQNAFIFELKWILPKGMWRWIGTWWRKVQVYPTVKKKRCLGLLSHSFYLLYPIIFPASPEVFPDHYQNKSLWVFFHLLILISLFFKLLDSYHFTPCFTNPGKKETFFVYLIYCLAASSSASYPRFIFWISAALKISSFFEMTRPWAFFAYEWRTLCAMHSEIRFCAVCTVEQDWLRMCS